MRGSYLSTKQKRYDEVNEIFNIKCQLLDTRYNASTSSARKNNLNLEWNQNTALDRQLLVLRQELGVHTPENAGKPYAFVYCNNAVC